LKIFSDGEIAVQENTLFDLHPTTLLSGLDLVPKDHAELAVLGRPCDKNLTFFFELLNCRWSVFPWFLQDSNRDATTSLGCTLDLGEKLGFGVEIVVMLLPRSK
jgi:hypothetical protein